MGIQDRLSVSFAHTPTRLVQSVDGGPPIQGPPIQGPPIQGSAIQGPPIQGSLIQGLPIQGPILQFRPVLEHLWDQLLGTSGRINKCILSVNKARQEALCIDWIDQHLTAGPCYPMHTHTGSSEAAQADEKSSIFIYTSLVVTFSFILKVLPLSPVI